MLIELVHRTVESLDFSSYKPLSSSATIFSGVEDHYMPRRDAIQRVSIITKSGMSGAGLGRET